MTFFPGLVLPATDVLTSDGASFPWQPITMTCLLLKLSDNELKLKNESHSSYSCVIYQALKEQKFSINN